MSRIIGQCNTADFEAIEHLAVALKNPASLDLYALPRKQRLALFIIAAAQEAGIKYEELLKVNVILFWSDGWVEWKFFDVPGALELKLKLRTAATQMAFKRIGDKLLNT